MHIGFLGLGRLGLPVSVAIVEKGHEIWVYDVNPNLIQEINRGFTSLQEPDLQEKLREVLASGRYHVSDLKTLVDESEIIFVAVPTPSLPNKSFDTKYVKEAIQSIVDLTELYGSMKVISVISTVLPTTIRNVASPIVCKAQNEGKNVGLCYNAYFIAMGTTIQDWLDPEFVLIGEEAEGYPSGDILEEFYCTIIPKETPIFRMTWEEAEITKMGYNVYIGFKIIVANTIMEFCEKIPNANCDVIANALSQANRRIVGSRYMKGGMGDGGLCHPRDADALGWLADKLDLSSNPFKWVMESRYSQTKYLANLAISLKDKNIILPLVILGKRFKANSNITDYSPALLLDDILTTKGIQHTIYDPALDGERPFKEPSVFIVTVLDESFQDFPFPKGSVIIDVWRFLKQKDGLTYYCVGGEKS